MTPFTTTQTITLPPIVLNLADFCGQGCPDCAGCCGVNYESKLSKYAWFRDNCGNVGEEYAHRVGQKNPNPWGLYDMHGNVWERCRDRYAQKLPGGRDPDATIRNSYQVMRGGGWEREAHYCRSAYRAWNNPKARSGFCGFRVALTSVQPAVESPDAIPSDASGRN
jgi:formylglycine-generating enzyme required for sulfatase activity